MKKSFTITQALVAIIFVVSTAISFGVYVRSEERSYNKEVNDIKAGCKTRVLNSADGVSWLGAAPQSLNPVYGRYNILKGAWLD